MIQAVFIGWRGQVRGYKVSMPDVWPMWLWFDRETKQPVAAPEKGQDTSGLICQPYLIEAGKPCYLPDPDKFPDQYKAALAARQFAKPEAETLINELYDQGIKGKELYNRLLAEGLVLLDPDNPPPIEGRAGGGCCGN